MFLGAVFEREVRMAPREQAAFVGRAVYCGTLLGIVATCWLVVTGSQTVGTVGDAGRFAATLLRILGPLQLALAMLAAALTAALSVSLEKDRRTLELLLVSRLGDPQLVLGKLAGSLLRVLLLIASAVPVFALVALFGGVSAAQLARLFVVTVAAALAAASIANAVAFWKDTTFQALAITAFALAAWLAAGEAVAFRFGDASGALVSPARGVFAALEPAGGRFLPALLGTCAAVIVAANAVAVPLARRWNTARETRAAPRPRAGGAAPRTRTVWSNPVLWREIRTRAHGRAMVVVRLAWLALFAAAVAGIAAQARAARPDRLAVAVAVVPMALASLLAVAALAVTSITSERDRGAFDLLLVSDLEPAELVWGKLGGVLVAAREIVLLPLGLAAALVALGLATPEHGFYLAAGLALLLFFAAVLGLYAGLSHTVSRQAIAVALGTVAFLFVGVATAMRIMVAFGGSFELQLAPFLAVIVGGGIGLYAALSARNPSPAVAWASALLPALTFTAIAAFIQGNTLQVFLVVVAAYGFATLAMLVPAIAAFDLLTGRTTAGD
jgi:ABC-type transport system involved in multi-copper enzyme maturation permease subunit